MRICMLLVVLAMACGGTERAGVPPRDTTQAKADTGKDCDHAKDHGKGKGHDQHGKPCG